MDFRKFFSNLTSMDADNPLASVDTSLFTERDYSRLPRLPKTWGHAPGIRDEFQAWLDSRLDAKKSADDINDEWRLGVRNSFMNRAHVRMRHAQVDNPFSSLSTSLFHYNNAQPLRQVTLEVRFYDKDDVQMRDEVTFTTLNIHVPATILVPDGFTLDDDAYHNFSQLLLQSHASHVLELMGGLPSHDWASGLRRIRVSIVGERDHSPDAPVKPIEVVEFGLTAADTALSHRFLPSRIVPTDGGYEFQSAVDLPDSVQAYFASQPAITDDCFYRAVLAWWKPAWDAHYNSPANKLTHALIQSELGRTDYAVRTSDIESFLCKRRLSCVILDILGNLVWKYTAPARNKHIDRPTIYLVAHDEHLWLVPKEKADTLAGMHVRQQSITDPREPVPAPPPTYPMAMPLLDEGLLTYRMVDTIPEVDANLAAYTAGDLSIHYAGSLKPLLFHLWFIRKIQPQIRVRGTAILSLTLGMATGTIRIVSFSVEGERMSKADAEAYLPMLHRIKPLLIHERFKTEYSQGLKHAFGLNPRSALMRSFVNTTATGQAVDIRAAYPSVLCSMDSIPVYTRTDDFMAYHGEPLDPYGIYLVEHDNPHPSVETWLVFNRTWNLVSGHTLLHCALLPAPGITIRAWIRPVHLEDNPFPGIVETVKSAVCPRVGKRCLNSLIGLTGKRETSATRAVLTSSYEEAMRYSSDVHTYSHGEHTAHLAFSTSDTVLLNDGFYAGIQFHVYDRMRLALLNLYRRLVSGGATVLGVHTDCFVVDAVPASLPLTEDRTLAAMGQYHLDGTKSLPFKRYSVEPAEPPTFLTMMEMATGYWRQHAFAVPVYPLFPYRTVSTPISGTLVLADVAGAGKTTLCKQHCRGFTLVVTPNNKRVADFLRQFQRGEFPEAVTSLHAMTTQEFIGHTWQGDRTAPSLQPYDTILVDELFLDSTKVIVRVVQRLATDVRPDTCVMGNGDTFQLTNVETFNRMGRKMDYCDRFLWRAFPDRMTLTESHRLTRSEDRATLSRMLTLLKAGMAPLAILRQVGLSSQIITSLEAARGKQCIAWTNLESNALNLRFGGPDQVGMTVTPKEVYLMKRQKGEDDIVRRSGFRTNEAYTVEGLDATRYLLRHDPGVEPVWLPRRFFRRTIAWTCNAVQGETIREPYVIFQAGDNWDWRWFYTAITRTDDLRKVFVYDGPPIVDPAWVRIKIRDKLASHRAYGTANGYTHDLTLDWVLDRLKSQNYKCAVLDCQGDLELMWDDADRDDPVFYDQFSIDRKDPGKGHTKANCRITHLRCNLQSAHEGVST
jgi:hypothetical protein